MPRLNQDSYLSRRRFLRYARANFADVFGIVPPSQQWRLHRYFQTQVDSDDAELIAQRKAITAADPSLPQRAGKLFVQVDSAFRQAFELSGGDEARFRAAIARLAPPPRRRRHRAAPVSAGGGGLRAWAIARPEPDLRTLAQALLMQVDDMRRQAERPADESPTSASADPPADAA